MKAFEYHRPRTVKEAVHLVAGDPDAAYIAGGTNLIDLMKRGIAAPGKLVDINDLPLKKIGYNNQSLRIGSLANNTAVLSHKMVQAKHPLLGQALRAGASGQLRNMATIGGNILQRTRCAYFYDTAFPCNKRSPGSGCAAVEGINRMHAIFGFDTKDHSKTCLAVNPGDMSVALVALDAQAVVMTTEGEKRVPFSEMHTLPGDHPERDTILNRGDLILSVELPDLPFTQRTHYLKVRDRASYAFALVSVAAAVDFAPDKQIRDIRLVMGGVAHKPWRLFDAEKVLKSQPVSEKIFKEAAEAGLADAKVVDGNAFKVNLSKNAIIQALQKATGLI